MQGSNDIKYKKSASAGKPSDFSAILTFKKMQDYILDVQVQLFYIKIYFEPVSQKTPACSSVTSMLVYTRGAEISLSQAYLNATLTIHLDGHNEQQYKTFSCCFPAVNCSEKTCH